MPNDKIFTNIESSESVLENPLEWIDTATWIELAKNIESYFPHITGFLFNAGKEITLNQISSFQLIFFKIAPLKIIFANIQRHIKNHVDRTISWKNIYKKNGKVELIITPQKNIAYSSQMCEFNKGCSLATAILKNYKNPHIEELQCAARTPVESCIYRITWDPENNILEKLKRFFFVSVRDQRSILKHLEQTHNKLQDQYKEILSMRDFYSHIMGNMDEAVVWLDKNGFIDFTNKSFLDLTGIMDEESHGKRFSDFLFDNRIVDNYNKLMEKCLVNPLVAQTAEFFLRDHEGNKRFGQTNIIWVPSEHRAPGYLITVRDITEKKIIEQQLYVEKDKHRALYENSPALIIGLDVNGKFVYANPAMVEESGYSEEELKTMNFKQLVAPEADYNMNSMLNNLLSQPSRLQEVHFKTKAGEWKAITLTTYQIFDADKTLAGLAGVGVDITETKRLNEQLIKTQRMELLGQMAGSMAHDFRNILTSIDGYSKLILARSNEEKIRNYAATIEKAGMRTSDLIKNLLTFSKGEVNKIEKFDLNDIVKEVNDLMKGVAPKDVILKTEVSDAPLILLGDPGKIHQCVLNLCMNSKDAIGKNDGTIIIRVKKAEKKEGFVWIQVEDTGPGIPPHIIDKVFDPFFTTKKETGGTGLGLSVVYGVIKAHKGDVFVDSRPGEGTTFTLELPAFIEENSKQPDGRKTIMVIDNDDIPRNYCKEILDSSGYKTVDFSKVKDAEDWLKEHANETLFALSDAIMPDMDVADFIETCQKIKKDFTCLWMGDCSIPEIKRFAPNGPFLKKPFTPTDLIETIKSLKL